MAKTEGGKRTVAGVHWDYDGYGATLKKVGKGGRTVLVWYAQLVLLEGVAAWLAPHASLAALIAHPGPPTPRPLAAAGPADLHARGRLGGGLRRGAQAD